MKKYIFKPYDPIFPELYRKEAERIRKILGKYDLIEHVGSTSVAFHPKGGRLNILES